MLEKNRRTAATGDVRETAIRNPLPIGLNVRQTGTNMTRTMRKGLSLLTRTAFVRAIIQHRVVAAVEHLKPIRFCAANTLIDAGANKGQFSLAFRTIRPRAHIIAFEPLPEAAGTFEELFATDDLTRLERTALGPNAGSAKFYVADRTDSSSLLELGAAQERAFGVRQATTIEVPVERLDESIDFTLLAHPIMLKVDVQGGEQGVFEGCDTLTEIDYIYVELSFVELYHDQPLFSEVNGYLEQRGFRIMGVFNQVVTAEYGPTQVDVLFERIPAEP